MFVATASTFTTSSLSHLQEFATPVDAPTPDPGLMRIAKVSTCEALSFSYP